MSQSPVDPDHTRDDATAAEPAPVDEPVSEQAVSEQVADTGTATDWDENAESPDEGAATEDVAEHGSTQALPAKLTFRVPGAALIAVLIATVCMSPLALSGWLFALLFLIPIGLTVWVMRVRTVVTRERISAASLVRTTTVDWDEVQSLRLDERRWVRAVLRSDREVRLPAVRIRDLPNLAAMSGGRLPDPTATIPHGA